MSRVKSQIHTSMSDEVDC